MSGHDFEKQVRQKLNDLKMTPSTEAWENIENSLRERKRRPVAFYWAPLLLLGLAAGGYLFLNNDQKTVLSDKNSTHNVSAQTKEPHENVPASDPLQGKSMSAPKSNGYVMPQESSTTTEDASGGLSTPTPKQKTAATGQNNTLAEGDDKAHASGVIATALQEKTTALPEKTTPQPGNTARQEEKILYGKNLSLKISDYPIETISPSPLNFIQAPKKSPSQKSKKWSFGLSAFAGLSAVNEGHLLNFNNAQVEDVSRVPAFAPRPSYTPSSISPGVTYSGGLFVKRQLNNRFSLSLGINYLQLNTRSKVGDREIGNQIVNAGASGFQAVTSYFRVERDKLSEYHNRYHFIEVPVELHTNLNRSEKMPIVLTTGMAASHLLRSTSLHFDGTTGVYYRNDELLNKIQVAAKTGVSVGILNKTKRTLWVGPSAKYNISRLLEKGVSSKTNFMSIGVDVKMFIK